MAILLKGGRVIDPESKRDGIADVLFVNGKIKKIGKNLKVKARVFNVRNKAVIPGLIDLHTHLREPGREDEETVATGTRAAAKGGFTTVCAMPNTSPPVDSVSGVKYILATAQQEGVIQVLSVGAITKERKGMELTEMGKMSKAGIVAVSDDGTSVVNAMVMRRAMEYSKMFNLLVISHSEDLDLSRESVMNEGRVSTILGLKGVPSQAEEVMVARDISLAELTGGNLHLAHITTQRSVSLIREAKKRRVKVTAEVTPHHLVLTEKDVLGYNTNCKVNPPLRTEPDRRALIKGLKAGIIDCIATDHAPHLNTEKNQEFDLAPFGLVGLETALPLLLDELVHKKVLSLTALIEKMSLNPARILKRKDMGRLQEGFSADVTVVDMKREKNIDNDFFISKSNNSPFIGRRLKGFSVLTFYQGKIVWQDAEVYP